MPRTTFAQVKASRIPQALNIPSTHVRLLEYVNEAVQKLLKRGHWWGTMQTVRIQATSGGLITMPPQVASIEKVALNEQPVILRDRWFEFIGNGAGVRKDEDTGYAEAILRGNFPTFSDIVGTDKKLRLVCDVADDVDKTVLVLGYDENGNWIRTTQGGSIADGEVVVLAQTPGTLTTKKYSQVTGVQPPTDLDGQWWLYEYSTTDTTQRLIGQYQHWEINPMYPRYLFPSLNNIATASNPIAVEAFCKLAFIPVTCDTDYVLIGDIPALKYACLAVKADEENRHDDAFKLMKLAEEELNKELEHYLGSIQRGISIQSSGIGTTSPVEVII